MTEQIENEASSEGILEGDVQLPNERVHLFKNHSALCDFTKTFNITNYNVRDGRLETTGEYVVQLTYAPVDN